jgi:hypothetical protein
MYPPDEKEANSHKWYEFLKNNPELASNIIREYLNYKNFDGAGIYEKWGILHGLPDNLRKIVIDKSFTSYMSKNREEFNDFLEVWGKLLLETEGYSNIVKDLDKHLYISSYNSELLKLSIKSNYKININKEVLAKRLLILYEDDYKHEQGWYNPKQAKISINNFIRKLNGKHKIEYHELPIVFIP